MPEVANLSVVVTADTAQAERGLADLGTKVSGVGSAISGALGTAAVGAVVGLGAAFAGSVKSAADFEKQVSAISAVTGATQTELDALTKTALQLGKDTSYSATEAAQGMEELAKAGVSVADIIGGAGRASLDLAAAGAISVADAAEIASNAMNVFNIEGSNMGHVADVIAGAANASAIGVNDYKFSLSAAGAVAAQAGVSFEDLSTAIAVMGQAGIKGSDAGTSLKTMFMNLQPSTKAQTAEFERLGLASFKTTEIQRQLVDSLSKSEQGQKELSKMQASGTQTIDNMYKAAVKLHLGYQDIPWQTWAQQTGLAGNAFYDASGKAKGMAEVADILQGAMAGMTKQQQLASLEILFGSDAIRAAAVLAEAGAAGFNEMAGAMGKVSAQQVAEERLNNLWGSLEKLKGSLETAAIMIGGLFTPALKGIVDVATEVVNAIIPIIEKIPEAWQDVVNIFTSGASSGVFEQMLKDMGFTDETISMVTGLIAQIGGAWEAMLPVIQDVAAVISNTLGPAFRSLGDFLGRHPELIAGVVAALAGFAVITTVVGWITSLIAIIGSLSTAITAAGGVIAAIIAVLGGPLTLAILAVAAVIGVLTAAWVGNWGDIQGKTAAAVGVIQSIIEGMLSAIQGFWEAHGETITTIVSAIWDMIVSNVQTALTVLGGVITLALQVISGDWEGAWNTLTTIAQAIWDNWVVQLQSILTILGALFAPFWDAIRGAFEAGAAAVQGVWDAGWAAIHAALTAAWGLLSAENQAKITELVAMMTELWTLISQAWTIGTEALTTLLSGWWSKVVTTWNEQQDAVTSTIQPFWDGIASIWQTMLDTVGGYLSTKWAEIVKATSDFFADLGNQFNSAITSLGDIASSIGTAIMDALIGAINAKVSEMVDSVTGAVKGALGAARNLIGGQRGASGTSDDPVTYLKQAALARGIDPEQVTKVMMKEGPTGWGSVGTFDTGTSYGPLQLHYAGGSNPMAGMGDRFTAATGIDLRTNTSVGAHQRAIDFALDELLKRGDYSEWYGADPALGSRFTKVAKVPPQLVNAQKTVAQIGQFGLQGGSLTPEEAAAFCGPAAAMWFASTYGMMPTKEQAEEMARQVGWTPGLGMAGPGSEVNLLTKMGLSTKFTGGMADADINAMAASGQNFILSTAGHYYQVSGGGAGGLNVGESGTALRGGGSVMTLDQIRALSGEIQGVITLSGQMGNAFTAAGVESGAALNSVLLSATTMSDGSTLAVTQMGDTISAELVSTSGEVIASATLMGTGVVQQASAMATGVTEQASTMSSSVLTSVTDLGGATMTTVTDMAGNITTTITDMNGNVTAQYSSMASDAVAATATMNSDVAGEVTQMSDSVLTSVTDLGGAIMTTTTDMAGNVTTTITDMNGNVTAQYSSLATDVTESVTGMSSEVLTSVTDLGDGILTITTDTNGEMVATITNANGEIVSQYGVMTNDVIGAVEQMSSDLVSTIGTMTSESTASAAELTSGVVGEFQDAVSEIGDAAGEWGQQVQDALSEAAEQAAELASQLGEDISGGIAEGISEGGDSVMDAVRDIVEDAIDEAKHEAESDSPSKLFARELGEPIAQGVAMGINAASGLVDDATRSLVDVPNSALGDAPPISINSAGSAMVSGMQVLRIDLEIGGRVAEQIYVEGRDLAMRRGRSTPGFGTTGGALSGGTW